MHAFLPPPPKKKKFAGTLCGHAVFPVIAPAVEVRRKILEHHGGRMVVQLLLRRV